MKVKATYVFDFEPDTSDLNPEFVDIKGIAQAMAENELKYMLENNEITTDDFDFEVTDDHDDHKLPDWA